MPRRRTTYKTCWVRTRSTVPLYKFVLALLAALLVTTRGADCAVSGAPSVAQILAAYDAATHVRNVTSIESVGTLTGEGLTGDFQSWRVGLNERDDERLGPRAQTTLRLGERLYLRTANGNVRELSGFLRRRALTADFVDSGAFLAAPERSRFLGYGTLSGQRMWRLEVCAPGGEPETLWIDASTGLLTRVEFLDGDGQTTVDFSDRRNVNGGLFPFRTVTSDGEHAYDVVQETTSMTLDGSIAPDVFAPLLNRTISADVVQRVPLVEYNAHFACSVSINGKPYNFMLDTGAQSVLLDSHVAKAAGLAEFGALEVRGATRSGGLHVLNLPRLDIGSAHLDGLVATSLDLHKAVSGIAQIDGILGVPFFAAALVELDFAHHTMRFGAPGAFEPRGQKIALDLDRGLVEARFRINNSLDAPFIIDTGNSGEVLLYRPFVSAHPGVVPFSRQSVANYGIGGSTQTYRSSLDEIALSSIPLYHQVADVVMAEKGAFADRVDAGNVGLGILKNFIVTFDLSNNALYLDKGETFDDGRLRMAITGS